MESELFVFTLFLSSDLNILLLIMKCDIKTNKQMAKPHQQHNNIKDRKQQ